VNVDLYEKAWMWAAGAMIAAFLAMIAVSTFAYAVRPPSHVETIDPRSAMQDPRFASPGVSLREDGSAQAVVVSLMFTFLPSEIRVPAGRPVTFRLTSLDVSHGFQVAGTNVNTMVLPGYVSQFTTTFARPGEYLVVCHEYCGLGHHAMHARLIVEASGATTGGPSAATDTTAAAAAHGSNP
jgi:cytochrome c oxidase subunit 2